MPTMETLPEEESRGDGGRLLGPWEVVKVARLGLMASHLWIFVLPAVLAGEVPGPIFWIGAIYVTVPLGMLIYGWNDYRDGDVDRLSERKRTSWLSGVYGYRLEKAKRRLLPAYIVALHLPFLILALVFEQPWFFGWMAVMVLGNWLYNGPGVRLSRVPVAAELTATGIYLSILWLGAQCSGVRPHWVAWLFAGAAILVFQIAGAIVDIEPDRLVRKVTFAVAVGRRWAASVLAAVVASKGILLLASFGAVVPALVNFAAIPLCLLGPARMRRFHPSGVAYTYFVVADWVCLAMLAG